MSKSFSNWPVVDKTSLSPFRKIRRVFVIIFPVIFFILTVWLIFAKIQQGPLAAIEENLKNRKFKEAAEDVKSLTDDASLARPRLLMYGAIARKGLPAEQKTEYIDYMKELKSEDVSGIFVKEAYRRQLELFYADDSFLRTWYDFLQFSPDAAADTELYRRGIITDTAWANLTPAEALDFFKYLKENRSEYLRVVDAENLQVRSGPGRDSEVLGRLRDNESVLIRAAGPEATIAGRKAQWRYIYSESQEQGWVFSGYLKKPDFRAEPSG